MKKRWYFVLVAGLMVFIFWTLFNPKSQEPVQLSPESSSEREEPTQTITPIKPETATLTDTPTPTLTPTVTPIACSSLISPEDNAEFEYQGKIPFEWTEQPQATSYQLEIFLPDGYVDESFNEILEATTFQRWLESLPVAGEYQWQITALLDAENPICTSELFSFTKEQYVPPAKSSSDNSSCTPEGWPDSVLCATEVDQGDGTVCCYDTCGNLMGCGSWGGWGDT
mgnify:CR=1 FL=1|jgi:hypothetical protein